MSKILFNKQLSKDFFLIKVQCENDAKMGQFYMLRAWSSYPVLSRPISVFDADERNVTFLYKVVAEGTEIFSRLKDGDEITLQGPNGTGFPIVDGKIAFVGGGVGIAPFYFAAKQLKAAKPNCTIDVFLGFSDEALLEDEFSKVADSVTTDVGGYITEKLEPKDYDHIFTCGPEVMMRALYKKCAEQNVEDKLLVSLENRMACGIGTCLVCSCKTASGNKKACKDGPVLAAKEVFGI